MHIFGKENQEFRFRYFKFEMSVRHPGGSVNYTSSWEINLEIISKKGEKSLLVRSKKRGLSLKPCCPVQYSSGFNGYLHLN